MKDYQIRALPIWNLQQWTSIEIRKKWAAWIPLRVGYCHLGFAMLIESKTYVRKRATIASNTSTCHHAISWILFFINGSNKLNVLCFFEFCMPYQKINIILSISFKFVCHIKSKSTHHTLKIFVWKTHFNYLISARIEEILIASWEYILWFPSFILHKMFKKN